MMDESIRPIGLRMERSIHIWIVVELEECLGGVGGREEVL